MIMDIPWDNEAQPFQLINKEKGAFIVYHKTTHALIRKVEEITRFSRGIFTLIYLRCLIGHANKKRFILLN